MSEEPREMEIVKFDRPVSKVRHIVSLEKLWQIFVRMRGDIALRTREDYDHYGRLFLTFMRGREMNQMTIIAWMDFLRTRTSRYGHTYNNYYINRVNSRIRSFIRWLKAMGYLYNDLADLIPHLSTPAAKPSIAFTEIEYERMKRYCAGRPSAQVYLWLIILGYRTGLSLIDCCYLRWQNVHLDENGPSYIDHYRIKTARFGGKALCQIPIIPGSDVHQWLINLKKMEPFNYKRFDGITDFVHQDAPGLYEGKSFWRIQLPLRKIFKACGIPKGKTFRNLRNSMCSNLVNSGTQIALVCKITGHNSVTTLLRYVKPDRRALQDGMMRAQQFSASQAGIAEPHNGFVDTGEGI